MPSKKVEWYEQTRTLSEIYQITDMQFAFLSSPEDGNRQCCSWAQCRDFLHDALRTMKTGLNTGIYGFVYKKDVDPPIDLKKTRMLVRKKSLVKKQEDEFHAGMLSAKKLINHFED